MPLITPNEIINGGFLRNSPVNARFDATLLEPHIADAEERHVQVLLGADLYADLITIKDGTEGDYRNEPAVPAFPGNATYEGIWTNGLMALCGWAVVYEAYPFITVKTSSQGAMVTNTEHSNNLGVKGIEFMMDTILQRIDLKSSSLKKYLCGIKDTLGDLAPTYCKECYTDDETDKYVGIIFY